MDIYYQNERAFYGTLEEFFTKVISANELKETYEVFFYEVKKRPRPKKKTVKATMVEAYLKLSQSPEDSQLFVDSLPKKTFQAYEILLWQDSLPVDDAQKKLGFKIVNKKLSTNQWKSDCYVTDPAFPFIGLKQSRDRYYHGTDRDALEFYTAILSPAIRKWLKPYFPKPKGYDIEPITDAEKVLKNHSNFDASPTITADLGQLADFLIRGEVPRTKKGDYTKASLRKADGLTASGEWYPNEGSKSALTLMRHEMLLDFIDGFDADMLARLTDECVEPQVFKNILKALQENEEMLSKWLIQHLKHRYTYYEETFDLRKIRNLFSLFSCIPIGEWVYTQNLQSIQYFQDINILFFEPGRYRFTAKVNSASYSYFRDYDLDKTYLQAVGIDPLIDAAAFLLSAFGFVEIAHQQPINERFTGKSVPYLTRFDGAYAVRLTEIGAYAFGLTSTLELKQTQRKVATLRLHPEQLHLTCRDLDPITKLALDEFMERVAPEFYRMTRASLLKGCQKPKDVRQRIADFRIRIPAELPQNWENFLSSLETEQSALQSERNFTIYTLADRPELQQQFMQDPVLRQLALRVEGHRIAIELKDMPTVRAHLRKLGYLVE